MSMKVDDFLAMVRKAVELPSLYVMGGWGFPLTDSNKDRTQKNDYNKRSARKKKIYAASADTFAWDCVGLTKGILWGWYGDASLKNGGASYAANGVPDWDAKEMMFKGCVDPTTDFSHIEPGEFLWLDGHCGVYLGDGLAAESTPSWKDGAQITCVSNIGNKPGYNKRKWTYHGHLKFVEYKPSKYPIPPFKVTVDQKELVRKGPYSDTDKVGYLSPGVYTVTEVGGSSGDYGKVEKGWIYLPDVTIGEEPKTLNGYTVGNTYEVLCSDPLNVRTKAEVSDSATIITALNKGTKIVAKGLTLDSEGNTWMRITAPAEGWICCIYHNERYVGEETKPESLDGYTVGKVYTVNAKGGLNVRQAPSTSAPIKRVLSYGAKVTCIGLRSVNGNTWMQMKDGWIAAHYNGARYVI